MSYRISSAIYVLLQFLPHIIPIGQPKPVFFFYFQVFHVHDHFLQIYTCTNYWNLCSNIQFAIKHLKTLKLKIAYC